MVNKRLRNLRRGANLTQSELAQVLGVTSATVGKYERGDLEPNNEIILKLADYFHCTTDYLPGAQTNPNTKPTLNYLRPLRNSGLRKWKF